KADDKPNAVHSAGSQPAAAAPKAAPTPAATGKDDRNEDEDGPLPLEDVTIDTIEEEMAKLLKEIGGNNKS
uniref:hypothetical protein n=1 Tax=Breoghania sp. TaxID=2065378 RepID=UPI0029C9EA15